MKKNNLGTVITMAMLGAMVPCVPVLQGQTRVLSFAEAPLVEPTGIYYGADGAGGFTSEGFSVKTSFTDWGGGFTSWSGVAASRLGDRETPGFANQYSAYPGGGSAGEGEFTVDDPFGIVYVPGGSFSGPLIEFPQAAAPQSILVANSTYAALSMLQGDDFTRMFGMGTGAPDWFKLTIFGLTSNGLISGFVEHYLADFRTSAEEGHFVQDNWINLDLSSLGKNVSALGFAIESTDQGDFGINTPTYVVIDRLEIAVPETPVPSVKDIGGGWYAGSMGYIWHGADLGDWVYHYPLGWLWMDRAAGEFQARTPANEHLDLSAYPRILLEGAQLYLFQDSTPGNLGFANISTGTVVSGVASLSAPSAE